MSTDRRGIGSDFIEKIKQANNIVAVAGRYLQLKQKGKTHWACCPFHHEKTASFAVNELQQYYHCFGCGVSGDVITLIQQLESLDFMGAVEFLAKTAGLDMPAVVVDENYTKNAKKKERVLKALDEVCKYYCSNLAKNQAHLDYLHKRGITDDLIKQFNIGLCADWNSSIKYLKGKGFADQELIDAGIALRNNSGLYDVMGMRITFAVHNVYGDCIGFSGRTLSTDKEIAKYKNTAQTMVFDKSNIVYGIDVLKKNKLANFVDKLIVVEGNVDVISLVGAGFVNTVACMGTALTAYHARIFKRFTDKVYICFDGDEAGQKATLRGLDILSAENLEVRVISIPDELDPDDYIKKYGKKDFDELITNALPLVDYKLEHLKKTTSLKDNLDKTKFLKAAVEILKPLANSAEIELYIPRICELTGISYDAIVKQVGIASVPKKTDNKAVNIKEVVVSSGSEPPLTAYARALNFIIASILHNKEYVNKKDFFDNKITIENKLYKRLIDKIVEYDKDSRTWNVARVFDEFDESEIKQLDPLINFQFEVTKKDESNKGIITKEGLEKYYKDCVQYMHRADLQKQVDNLKKKYKETNDTEEKIQITVKIQELNKRIKNK